MTSPDLMAVGGVMRRTPPTLTDIVAAEQTRVTAGEPGCGYRCLCHAAGPCLRVAHPHDPDADMGPDRPKGNVVPHAWRDADSQTVQWTCVDEAQQAMTAADHAEALAKAQADHTRAVLAGLDPAVLRAHLGLDTSEATG